jgi:hypothetical protein
MDEAAGDAAVRADLTTRRRSGPPSRGCGRDGLVPRGLAHAKRFRWDDRPRHAQAFSAA